MLKTQVEEVERRCATTDDKHIATYQFLGSMQSARMKLTHRARRSLLGGDHRRVVCPGCSNQVTTVHGAPWRLEFPHSSRVTGALDGSIYPDSTGQVELLDPRLDVRKNVRLRGPVDRKFTQGPIQRADLDVLSCGKIPP